MRLPEVVQVLKVLCYFYIVIFSSMLLFLYFSFLNIAVNCIFLLFGMEKLSMLPTQCIYVFRNNFYYKQQFLLFTAVTGGCYRWRQCVFL